VDVYTTSMAPKYQAPYVATYVDTTGAIPTVCTERGVREVKTEEWEKLKGCYLYWGTMAKYRRQIIQEPSLNFWSVLGDALTPALIHAENPKLEQNEEDDTIYTNIPPLSHITPWEDHSSDEESEDEVYHLFPGQLELPPNMDAPFEWEAPGLKEGGDWCEEPLDKVRTITEGWHDQGLVMNDAQRLLDSHRLNYTSQGAQCMDILWWEFPPNTGNMSVLGNQ
jgi:hypothetical protein